MYRGQHLSGVGLFVSAEHLKQTRIFGSFFSMKKEQYP